jgi:fucose permease
VDRIGYRNSFIGAHALTMMGLVAFGLVPTFTADIYAGMTVSVVIYSIGAGVLEVMVSPLTEQLPTENKAASMSLVHSFYCWGQVAVIALTTLAVMAFGYEYWWLMFIVWAAFPLINVIRGFLIPFPETLPSEKRTSISELFKTPLFWLMLLIMMCGGAAEQTMAQWASVFAEKGVGVPKVWGDLLGPCLFAIFMGTGRSL